MTAARHTLDTGLHLLIDGPASAKAGSAALLIVLTALWDAATSLVVAILLLFWILDMLSGVLRAVDAGGLAGFDWDKFWEGFRKLLIAGVILSAAVGGDLLLSEGGVTIPVVFVAVGSVLSWGFFWSTLQNADHFYPGIRVAVARILRARIDPPRDPEP